tara:strand:- start:354 stop:773 length:420 start_codon:yes stop_codon:yes gene_type:complete
MRTIKFRAKAIVNDKYNNIKVGDFVFGHYIESGCDAPCIIFCDGEQIEVDKNTLGQLTGLTDQYGKGIYENDIVKSTATANDHNQRGATTITIVKFFMGNACLCFTGCESGVPIYPLNVTEVLEVIGNTFDNPEKLPQK